ncbi:Hypothetical predicted protein [Xyrichtys novacula]|uniref:Uncharacterized protein n=1 Tax=Xyrichtys novacula TaxID=13765 RepID=A0AAV1GXV3_XYRNO|nr:Hypothetical predicted protein [Xyrichtys novacula]
MQSTPQHLRSQIKHPNGSCDVRSAERSVASPAVCSVYVCVCVCVCVFEVTVASFHTKQGSGGYVSTLTAEKTTETRRFVRPEAREPAEDSWFFHLAASAMFPPAADLPAVSPEMEMSRGSTTAPSAAAPLARSV